MTEKKTDVLNLRLDACVSTEIDHTKRPVSRQVTSSTATPREDVPLVVELRDGGPGVTVRH